MVRREPVGGIRNTVYGEKTSSWRLVRLVVGGWSRLAASDCLPRMPYAVYRLLFVLPKQVARCRPNDVCCLAAPALVSESSDDADRAPRELATSQAGNAGQLVGDRL